MNDHLEGRPSAAGDAADEAVPFDPVCEVSAADLSEVPEVPSEDSVSEGSPETAEPPGGQTTEQAEEGASEQDEAVDSACPGEQAPQDASEDQGEEPAEKGRRRTVGSVIVSAVLIVLCIVLVPILACNLTLIIKGSIYPDEPPTVFGIAPFAVTTDDMTGEDEGCFGDGALIFVDILTDEEKQSLEVGDVVTFRWEGAFVTYRIRSVERDEETGLITSVTTMGDNVSSDVSEPVPVPIEDVVGIHTGGIEGLGAFAMFLQTPVGVLVFVGIPVVAYVIYDILRVTLHNRRVRAEEKEELAAKEEELARLKALVEGPAAAEAAVEEPAPEVLLEEEPPEEFPPEDGGAL